jgi:protein Mpv17
MSTLNAVSMDVERPTTISLDYTDAMHDTHNNNATVLGPLEQSSLSCTDDDLESLFVLDGREPSPIPEPEQKFTSEQKFVNLVVLSMAFGYAFYTILSIDGGMARGWSASEIAMRIPLDNWGAYESYLANKPIITKSLINVIIYLLGDWLSQTAFRKQNLLEFDLARTLRNGFIGLCFGPLVHEYYEFSDAILPPENGLVVRLQKIFMDQTIYLTAKCCLYISAVGLLAGEEWETVSKTVQDKIGGIVLTA